MCTLFSWRRCNDIDCCSNRELNHMIRLAHGSSDGLLLRLLLPTLSKTQINSSRNPKIFHLINLWNVYAICFRERLELQFHLVSNVLSYWSLPHSFPLLLYVQCTYQSSRFGIFFSLLTNQMEDRRGCRPATPRIDGRCLVPSQRGNLIQTSLPTLYSPFFRPPPSFTLPTPTCAVVEKGPTTPDWSCASIDVIHRHELRKSLFI